MNNKLTATIKLMVLGGLLTFTATDSFATTKTTKAKEKQDSTEQPTESTTSKILEFKLALAEDGKTYQVIMKPSATPKPDLSLSGQVTIKVPHDSKFQAANVKTLIPSANWVEASRVDAPSEDAAHDYISFSFVGLQGSSSRNYAWQADKEQTIFTFENEKGCVSDVSLMANNDAFNVSPNSANTNPGNHFTNLGWGNVSENNFKGIYGTPITCPK